MALQFKTSTRNAWLDKITTDVGVSGLLKLFSGAVPANVAAADPAGLLSTLTLNAGAFAAAAAAGVLTLNAITQDPAAAAGGTAISFRMYTSGGTCILQGTVGTAGSDLNLVTNVITAGQPVSVTSWTITAPGA